MGFDPDPDSLEILDPDSLEILAPGSLEILDPDPGSMNLDSQLWVFQWREYLRAG
jgi:hypothetical protein